MEIDRVLLTRGLLRTYLVVHPRYTLLLSSECGVEFRFHIESAGRLGWGVYDSKKISIYGSEVHLLGKTTPAYSHQSAHSKLLASLLVTRL